MPQLTTGITETCRVIFVVDAAFVAPTAVTLFSALETASRPLEITLYADDVASEAMDVFHQLARHDMAAGLTIEPIDLSMYPDQFTFNLPRATCGRLVMATRQTGKAVYLDGDTLVLHDLCALFDTDLKGAAAGAALDTLVRGWFMKSKSPGRPSAAKYQKMIADRGALMPNVDFDRYVNAGVMLFDFDRIHDLGLAPKIAEIEPVLRYPLFDQDHLNTLLADHIHLLDAAWNSQWGNMHTSKKIYPKAEREAFRRSREDPFILHYTGPRKPWKKITVSRLLRALGIQQILQLPRLLRFYRLYHEAQARMERFLSALPPAQGQPGPGQKSGKETPG